MGERPPPGALVEAQVGAQVADRVGRRRPVVATQLVCVGRAQLALHLPHQVRELEPAGHLVEQGKVPVVHRLPVHPRHVLDPEVGLLQAPRLGVHLPPLRRRVDRDPDAAQVDPSALAAGRRLVLTLGRLLARLDDPEPGR